MDYQETQMYGDVMAMVKKTWGDFTLDAAIGGSINDKVVNSTRYDSKNASLKFANVFNIANIVMNSSASIDQRIDQRRQLQSIFGTAQIGYKEKLFLDLTARNDWASTLSYTSHEKSGFAYPSVGLSMLLDKWVKLPEWVSFAKLRGAYSKGRLGLRRLTAFRQQVSADLPPNRTYMFPCIRLSINNINLFTIAVNRSIAILTYCKRFAVLLNHQFMPICVWLQ